MGKIIGGYVTLALVFILPFMIVYSVPFSQGGNTAILLLIRSILTFAIVAPVIYYVEKRTGSFLNLFQNNKKIQIMEYIYTYIKNTNKN